MTKTVFVSTREKFDMHIAKKVGKIAPIKKKFPTKFFS